MELKPCLYRSVDDAGRVLCGRIHAGEREVSPTLCQNCPIAEINCAHLRASLTHTTRPPILVRFGNGRTELWDDPVPPLAFQHAACAAKIEPIHNPHACSRCSLRQNPEMRPCLPVAARALQHRRSERATVPLARAHRSEPRIIRLHEWTGRAPAVSPLPTRAVATAPQRVAEDASHVRPVNAEKCVGWTD